MLKVLALAKNQANITNRADLVTNKASAQVRDPRRSAFTTEMIQVQDSTGTRGYVGICRKMILGQGSGLRLSFGRRNVRVPASTWTSNFSNLKNREITKYPRTHQEGSTSHELLIERLTPCLTAMRSIVLQHLRLQPHFACQAAVDYTIEALLDHAKDAIHSVSL